MQAHIVDRHTAESAVRRPVVPCRMADTWWFGSRARIDTGLSSRGRGADAFALQRSMPALQFSVRLRVARRSFRVRHAAIRMNALSPVPRPNGRCDRYVPPPGQSRWIDHFSFKTECRLEELPTAAGRETGTFCFACFGNLLFAATQGKAQSGASTNRDKIFIRSGIEERTSK